MAYRTHGFPVDKCAVTGMAEVNVQPSWRSLVRKRLYEPRCEKIGLRGFRPGPTQTGLYSHTRWLEAGNFGIRKERGCSICVAKTKALISFAVTAKLICAFVFAFAKITTKKKRFSHDAALIYTPFLAFMEQ